MTQLIGRYERPLFRFLVRMTGDSHLAEDLFQETFLRLHRSRERFDRGAPLKPYLYRIALNLVRDARARKAARPPMASLNGMSGGGDGEGGALAPSPLGVEGSPAAGTERTELQGKVRAALDTLPEMEREVVLLRVFEGLTFAEIAEATGVPVPTAKSRMLYALRRLRPVLEGYMS